MRSANTVRVWRTVVESAEPPTATEVAGELEISISHTQHILLHLVRIGALSRRKVLIGRGRYWCWAYSSGAVSRPEEFLISDESAHNRTPAPDAGDAESRRLSAIISQYMRSGGWASLAGAVLTMAIRDWRVRDGQAEEFAQRMMFASPGEEIAEFWESDLGQVMRDWLGFGEVRLEEIGVTAEGQRQLARVG